VRQVHRDRYRPQTTSQHQGRVSSKHSPINLEPAPLKLTHLFRIKMGAKPSSSRWLISNWKFAKSWIKPLNKTETHHLFFSLFCFLTLWSKFDCELNYNFKFYSTTWNIERRFFLSEMFFLDAVYSGRCHFQLTTSDVILITAVLMRRNWLYPPNTVTLMKSITMRYLDI